MIAYFILVHRYPEQFKRLFKAIYSPKNCYLVHVDKRSGDKLLLEIKRFLAKFKNTSVLPSQHIIWGGYSMVDVELKAISKLLLLNKKWSHFVNLSGQDFPIKSKTVINKFMKGNLTKSFLLTQNQIEKRANTLNRIKNYFVESKDGFIGTPIKRAFMLGVIPMIGGQWKILTRQCCEFIATSRKVSKFRKYYRHTLIPDESFFQTVLANTGFLGKVVNDDKRAIVWVPDPNLKYKSQRLNAKDTQTLVDSGKIKLRPKTFSLKDKKYLLRSTSLFARKFDMESDPKIFDVLEASFKRSILKTNVRKNQVRRYPKISLIENIGERDPINNGLIEPLFTKAS